MVSQTWLVVLRGGGGKDGGSGASAIATSWVGVGYSMRYRCVMRSNAVGDPHEGTVKAGGIRSCYLNKLVPHGWNRDFRMWNEDMFSFYVLQDYE